MPFMLVYAHGQVKLNQIKNTLEARYYVIFNGLDSKGTTKASSAYSLPIISQYPNKTLFNM